MYRQFGHLSVTLTEQHQSPARPPGQPVYLCRAAHPCPVLFHFEPAQRLESGKTVQPISSYALSVMPLGHIIRQTSTNASWQKSKRLCPPCTAKTSCLQWWKLLPGCNCMQAGLQMQLISARHNAVAQCCPPPGWSPSVGAAAHLLLLAGGTASSQRRKAQQCSCRGAYVLLLADLTRTGLCTLGEETAEWQTKLAAQLCLSGFPLGAPSVQREVPCGRQCQQRTHIYRPTQR